MTNSRSGLCLCGKRLNSYRRCAGCRKHPIDCRCDSDDIRDAFERHGLEAVYDELDSDRSREAVARVLQQLESEVEELQEEVMRARRRAGRKGRIDKLFI